MASPPPPPPLHRQSPLLLKTSLYVATGIMQPVIVDHLRMSHCLGRKGLLIPTLARTCGMALVGALSTPADRAALRRLLRTDGRFRASLATAACVDLISGMLLTGGILLTGGAIFVVLYNSTPVWTALLSWRFLGTSLGGAQSAGVVVVCAGLMLNVLGTADRLSRSRDEALAATIGSAIVLAGCVLHAAFFVLSDRSLRGTSRRHGSLDGEAEAAAITPPLWSSCLGTVEAMAMAIYVAGGVATGGFQPGGAAPEDACGASNFAAGFGAMLLVDAVHSAAFFLMLRRIGAVGSALLKGVQSVSVVMLSAAFYCPREEAQCLTITKAASVILVTTGTLLYAASSPGDAEQPPDKRKEEPPSVEIESLLDT